MRSSWDIRHRPTAHRRPFFHLDLLPGSLPLQDRRLEGVWCGMPCSGQRVAPGDLSERGDSSHQLVRHADNGSPMEGATLLANSQALGVVPSLSNDSPYSESLLKILK